MSVADGLAADFVEAAADPDVPAADLGVLAQALDAELAAHPERAQDVLPTLGPVLAQAEGPPLFIAAVLVGGLVERGAPPGAAAPLVPRLQGWLHEVAAAGSGAVGAFQALDETWRAAVAVLGAWPEARLALQADLPAALAAARAHPGAGWLVRLLSAPHRRPLEVEAGGARWAGSVTGVADVAQLAVLVNAALGAPVPATALACAQGVGPQVLQEAVTLPWGLAVPGEGPAPEHASLPELFGLDEPVRFVAVPRAAPTPQPVGRAFATLRAELALTRLGHPDLG